MDEIEDLKRKGNDAFKAKEYAKAKGLYSEALNLNPLPDTAALLLTNRAACSLKLSEFSECESDCKSALVHAPESVKALFRQASAQYQQGNLSECMSTIKRLLRIEPNNSDAQQLMRNSREQLVKQESEQTSITRILGTMKIENKTSVENGLKALIDLCKDDVYHALEFAKKGGFDILNLLFLDREVNLDCCVIALKFLALVTSHTQFVMQHVDWQVDNVKPSEDCSAVINIADIQAKRLSLLGLSRLITLFCSKEKIIKPLMVLIMNMLKQIPASPYLHIYEVEVKDDISLSLSPKIIAEVLSGFKQVMLDKNIETYSMACDAFGALISDLPNYYDMEKTPDHRSELLEDRKKRLHKQNIYRIRAKTHAEIASNKCGYFDLLAELVDDKEYFVRSNASSNVGKLIKALSDEESIKFVLKPLLPHPTELEEIRGESKSPNELVFLAAPYIATCRKRAALEAALLVTHPELGSWALQQEGGSSQIVLLIGTNDYRCLEVASEVLCLAAGVESANNLLSTLVANQVVHSLLYSTFPTVRAAAASVLTKLSLKAKALSQQSEEISQILNAVTGVLKATAQNSGRLERKREDEKKTGLVSFSSYDNTANQDKKKSDGHAIAAESKIVVDLGRSNESISLNSIERAIEVVAAIVGKTFVKEEIVHGSSRVASLIADLAALDVDPRSTAAYGIAHILAALTVTNRELKAIALAEKEITVEQYEQMQELQRIKAKDEDGTVIEEKKEDPDNDTIELCNMRIRRIVAHDGLKALLNLVEKGSMKTKEMACRALRQILVETSVRGNFIQQGGLKACSNVADEKDLENAVRFEAAHAVAKALITTNPNVLSEHLRLTSIKALVFLCKEVDASYLQQFEALLALTNVLSCRDAEKERFTSEKGVNAVHYQMFSQNLMIRRAAAEALCNMSDHEGLWKVLRVGEKVKLWLALSEDWEPESEERDEQSQREAFLTARATAGTLAIAANDKEVANAMKQENCAKTICILLETAQAELVHRTLVMIQALLNSEAEGIAMHLLEGGVVPAMNVVVKSNQEQLVLLAKECAQQLSAAIPIRDK